MPELSDWPTDAEWVRHLIARDGCLNGGYTLQRRNATLIKAKLRNLGRSPTPVACLKRSAAAFAKAKANGRIGFNPDTGMYEGASTYRRARLSDLPAHLVPATPDAMYAAVMGRAA